MLSRRVACATFRVLTLVSFVTSDVHKEEECTFYDGSMNRRFSRLGATWEGREAGVTNSKGNTFNAMPKPGDTVHGPQERKPLARANLPDYNELFPN